MSNTKRPLWKVMRDAYIQSSGTLVDDLGREVLSGPDREEFAAMLCAIANWLEAIWAAQGPPASIPMEFVEGLSIGMKMHREGTLNILRAEADRAEAGG
jgi:hypothetical protein